MANFICWICNDNLSFKEYRGTKHLDNEGNKPCFDCLLEAGEFDEEKEAES